jgi:hypothetical protein
MVMSWVVLWLNLMVSVCARIVRDVLDEIQVLSAIGIVFQQSQICDDEHLPARRRDRPAR